MNAQDLDRLEKIFRAVAANATYLGTLDPTTALVLLQLAREGLAAREAHEVLDEAREPRDSAEDEMPPGAELSLAERMRRFITRARLMSCPDHPGQICCPTTPGVYECAGPRGRGRLLAATPIVPKFGEEG